MSEKYEWRRNASRAADFDRCSFDEWQPDREQRIAQRNARMRESAGIEDQKSDAVRRCRMDAADELVLGIALERDQLVARLTGQLGGAPLDRLEGVGAVDARLAAAEQVQIRAVQKQHSRHAP